MRIIHRASLVFRLTDIYSKAPITNASIFLNEKSFPNIRKKDGHYVFADLYPATYEVSIKCAGYVDLNFSVILQENQTKIVRRELSYSLSNSAVKRLTRFEITVFQGTTPLPNAPVTVKLKNEISYLKLVEPTPAGKYEVKLNTDIVSGLLDQKFIYKVKKKEHELIFTGYDQEGKCFVLKDQTAESIDLEGKFYAVWDVITDSQGKIIMPFMSKFMKETPVKLECTFGDLKSNVSADVSELKAGDAVYLKVKFKKPKA